MVPALLLAAGLGRRLSLPPGVPKALLELDGRTLMARTIDALEAAGFDELVVVTGYGADSVRTAIAEGGSRMRITECWNAEYDTANNIVSFLAAERHLARGVCLLNSDIVFAPSIVAEVATLDDGNWLVVDGDEPLHAEEMKVELDTEGRVARVSKGLDPATSAGEYIGILRLDAAGAATAIASARTIVADGGRDLYYEDAVDRAAAALAARPMWTRRRPWTEIDDEADRQRALGVAAELDRAVQR
ncbi:MAG TPA: NTP transferase domain-containing protein [Candidatus Limnocylindrales bacterium]|jgi:choline kinase